MLAIEEVGGVEPNPRSYASMRDGSITVRVWIVCKRSFPPTHFVLSRCKTATKRGKNYSNRYLILKGTAKSRSLTSEPYFYIFHVLFAFGSAEKTVDS